MHKPKKSTNKGAGPSHRDPLPSPDSSNGIAHTQLALRSAPLPLPSELEAYEAILPGAAERIFAMAENQSKHRQGMEMKALSIEGRNSLLGIIAGWFIGVLGLSIAGFSIYSGHDTAGSVIGGISLASLVGTFIYGTRERRIEREQKYLISQDPHRNRR